MNECGEQCHCVCAGVTANVVAVDSLPSPLEISVTSQRVAAVKAALLVLKWTRMETKRTCLILLVVLAQYSVELGNPLLFV